MSTEKDTRTIDRETLRAWLDAHKSVTVLDIRTDDDYAQWAIPGSVHINAYEALRNGQPGALAEAYLPPDRPVITICNAGRVSQTAAALLAERGFDARSLAGGMNGWSLAWNTARVLVADPTVEIIQVRRTGKGCLSYIIGSESDAAVIDPSLSVDVYLALARENGWSIRFVLETHVHADHVSRARELAQHAGATLVLPRQDRVTFAFTPLADGDLVAIGKASLTALHTPGHTNESMCFRLNDSALFTGDTLFTDGVGRPDLHAADVDAARRRAAALYASLERVRSLSPKLLVLPAHTSEPVAFDRRPVTAAMADVVKWLSSWLESASSFVTRVTSNLPETPPNFTRIVALNEAGEFPTDDLTDLEAGANRCAVR
ncbi:MAG TPA: MBL fold metallo-hydrolase [Vicinamibacterales bacterium]|nr:MBL fold metallo-hydrolase [Vicinamibacterales bacterium]